MQLHDLLHDYCFKCLSELNDVQKEMLNHVWIRTGVCGDVVIVTHNTTTNLTCVTSEFRPPDWYANGTWVPSTGDRYRVSISNDVYYTATLTINGNLTCETVNVYCEVITTERQFVHMHNTTLRFQGWLHSIWHELLQRCTVN